MEPVTVWWWESANVSNPAECPLLPIFQRATRHYHEVLWLAELVDCQDGPLIRTSESMYLPGYSWILRAEPKYPGNLCGTWFNGQKCELIEPQVLWDYHQHPTLWGKNGWADEAMKQAFPAGAPQSPVEATKPPE